jgi:hypothetical protein
MRAYTSLTTLKQAGAKVLNRSDAFFDEVDPVRRQKLRHINERSGFPVQGRRSLVNS